MGDPGVIVTAAQSFLGSAVQGLRRRFPAAEVDELAPEVARLRAPEVDVTGVAAACRELGPGVLPLPFVRHLAAEDAFVPERSGPPVAEVAAGLVASAGHGDVAVQVWSSGDAVPRAPEVRSEVVAALDAAGVATARGGRPVVLGVCLTPAGASVGLTPAAAALADWPGGRIVLGRPAEQVSRAEWKLEELYKLEALPRPPAEGRSRALDLGASPGGWTRILRSLGYEVWAVDPGALHPKVAADPGVHHERTTAGQFLATTDVRFDLVVNDMRMVPESSCQVVVDAAARLRPGGLAVVTLKVGRHQPAVTVRRALDVLARAYRPVLARQLFHNRNEASVVARRTDGG